MLFSLIYTWGQWISLSVDLKNSLLVFLPAAAAGVIFPSASAALLFTFFDYRKKKIRLFSAVLTATVIYIILFFGFRLASSMTDNQESFSFQPFNEKKIHVTNSSIIYTDECGKDSVEGIIMRGLDSETPGFKYYPDGKLTAGEHPALIIDSERVFNIEPSNPVFYETFKARGVFGPYLNDMGYLNNSLKTAAHTGGLDFLLLTAAITAFLMSCLLFKGATVWPLFDFIIILAFHRLFYYLFVLFSDETTFISETFFGGKQLNNVPLFIITGFTLILFLCGLLIKLTVRRKAE